MSAGIVIIGGGFAARQLVKNIRKTDTQVPLTVIAADSIDEYNKPDLSHVISLNQRADDLIRQSAQEFAQQYNVALFPHTRISGIDAQQHLISSDQQQWHYDKLVLATGATPCRPPVPGNELMLTLNSREDFQRHETQLRNAQRVLILGSGLIGTELAMDFCRAGKTVTLADMAASILSSLMPAELSSRLRHNLSASGVRVLTGTQLQSLKKTENETEARFDHDCVTRTDVVIAATGLKPDTSLAELAGLTVRRGIVTDSSLQTSDPDIYALGDCAEIDGKVMQYLQPIMLSAVCLAKNLTGGEGKLTLPPMLIRVKTPDLPVQLAGDFHHPDLQWSIDISHNGMTAKGHDSAGNLHAFAVTEDKLSDAFTLLRQLPQH